MTDPTVVSLPLGYRFRPTDEEIIVDFLYHKINGSLRFSGEITDSDIYGDEEEWATQFRDGDVASYFSTKLKKKSEGGKRVCRAPKTGTWRDDVIHIPGTKIHVGFRRSFKFVPARPGPGWIMHEFRIGGELLDKIGGCDSDYVICRIKREKQKIEK